MGIDDKKKIQSSYLEGERLAHFKSLTGLEYKEVYTQEDISDAPERPGVYPFTRGIHKTMYRGRLWTRRQRQFEFEVTIQGIATRLISSSPSAIGDVSDTASRRCSR